MSESKIGFKWFTGSIDTKVVIGIVGAIVSVAFFFKDSHENWDKTNKLEQIINTKAELEDFNALKDQVNRQYSVQRDKDKEQDIEIEKSADWVQYQNGYQQALKDYKLKP